MRRVLVAGLMLAARPAVGDPGPRERAAVAAVDLGPTVPRYVTAKATAQIEEGLAAAGYEVVSPTAARPLSDQLARCREGVCVAQVGAALSVQAVVYATIVGQNDNTIITMRLFDARTARQDAEVREVCELCGETELTERLGVAASVLRARAEEARAHRVRLTAEEPPRAPAPPPPRPPPPGADRSLVPGIAIGVASLGVIAGGLYLLAIDGRGTCSPGDLPEYPDPGAVIRFPEKGNRDVYVCRDIYRTRTLGIVGLGVGALGVAASAVLVVRARGSHRSIEVAPAPGGASVRVSLPW